VKRFCSLFSQILDFVPRTDFQRRVKELGAERHARGVTCWQQFVAMLFCQLGRAHTLREIEQGLKSCEGKLSHLGIEPVKRSSLSYVNGHRRWELYQAVFYDLLGYCRSQGPWRHKFRFKNKLMSLDSSVIELCLSMYNWAKFTRAKGAVKLHLLLDHDGYLPAFAVLTTGKVHDVRIAQAMTFQPGTIIVEDRGYLDYELFASWTAQRVYFVTRMRTNAVYEVIESLPAPTGDPSGNLQALITSMVSLVDNFMVAGPQGPRSGRKFNDSALKHPLPVTNFLLSLICTLVY